MNRRERRKAAKIGDMVEIRIKIGRVVFDIKPGADTSKDICYVCGKPATAWPYPERGGTAHGCADVNGQDVLLCEACFNTDDVDKFILRKYWNAPNLVIEEDETYESVEQLRRDIADAGRGTKH
jgi:hypothetical protein